MLSPTGLASRENRGEWRELGEGEGESPVPTTLYQKAIKKRERERRAVR